MTAVGLYLAVMSVLNYHVVVVVASNDNEEVRRPMMLLLCIVLQCEGDRDW